MDQRFKQFSGLVDNCEFNTGEKETTCQDLQGFWDMVYFQVEDVDKKFDDLEKLKARNWEPEEVKKPVKIKKKIVKVTGMSSNLTKNYM
ncbi:disks large-associated protein 5-like [Branchiostoma floridae]|uniref:Disks large-associated protein 5-like n=1 Tax=Branchiostoma floridae TaxID=7739 RepID=A0A9J7N1A6_BRAFL|nr:disks large-associated protein 5-like [Branchiostoma floridae]